MQRDWFYPHFQEKAECQKNGTIGVSELWRDGSFPG